MSDVSKAPVTRVEALPNRQGKNPAWSLTLAGEEGSVFSLLPAKEGDEIYYRENIAASGRAYLMRVQKDSNGDWVNAMPEQSESTQGGGGSYNNRFKKLPPLTPQDAVSIYAQLVTEADKSGLMLKLFNSFEPEQVMQALNSMFIASSRPMDNHDPVVHPTALQVMGGFSENEEEEAEQPKPENDKKDVLDTL